MNSMKKSILALWMLLTISAGAQPLSFRTLDGKTVSQDELAKGGPLILVTWCAECPSCRLVEKNIDRLSRDYRDRANVVVVDVNAHDTESSINKWLGANKLKFNVVIDEPGGLVERYKVLTTTTTFIFDKAGQLRYSGNFQTKEDETARQALTQLLKGEKVSPDKTSENGCTFPHRKSRS